jgi:hypothetical protein
MASSAVAAVSTADPVEVMGAGLIADVARRLLSGRVAAEGHATRPVAVIDVTGDPARIVAATRRLADRGVLVLAGESAGRLLSIDLYTDVHRRGLEIVGIGRPGSEASLSLVQRVDPPPPARVDLGGLVPGAARWYRVSGTLTVAP